ncbi:MAG: hypothetical protein K0Q95_347 [Bacteroidota bacterium]|jgi:hypothetical protein|nr:hypothetical protein [Bacteroidota bacterium]
MAKNDHQKQRPAKREAETVINKKGLFVRIEEWFQKHDKKVFYSLLFLTTLFSLLLFDSKVSEGGDDSSYIQRAWSLLHEGVFPYYQGPGYPIVLSLIVKFFGLNVIVMKLFSVLCQIGFVWFMYKAFNKRIPYAVLFALISFISFNHFILYYASQTFTETFTLFLQAICLYVTFRIIDSIKDKDSWMEVIRNNYKKWLLFGFMFMMLSISKSIAIVCIIGVILYFLLRKEYKQAVYALLAFIIFRVLFTTLATTFFGPSDSDQFEMILRKELYRPAAGHEDMSGLIKRFFDNFNIYISLHMYRILNLRNANTDITKVVPALSYISTIVIGIFAVMSYRKNKYVFFSTVYFVILCFGIFIGIQAANMQDRLIIIAMPLIFLVLYFGAYELAKRSAATQTLLLIFSVCMLLITVGKSTILAKENTTALKKNLNGDIYYGYTPDWENFLKMSKYCADSLPDSAGVLSRKPNMSFIYGNGKKFIGQYWVTTTNADSVQMEWKAKKVEYIILPNIRMNPKKNNGRVINTIHRMLIPFYQKYPQKLKLVKTIGTTEKCELFKITY